MPRRYGRLNLETIRKRREILGLTQQDIAQELGISHKSYSLIERGERKLSLERAAQIADLINLHLEDFFLKPNSTK